MENMMVSFDMRSIFRAANMDLFVGLLPVFTCKLKAVNAKNQIQNQNSAAAVNPISTEEKPEQLL
jgi:hypothetical protein